METELGVCGILVSSISMCMVKAIDPVGINILRGWSREWRCQLRTE